MAFRGTFVLSRVTLVKVIEEIAVGSLGGAAWCGCSRDNV